MPSDSTTCIVRGIPLRVVEQKPSYHNDVHLCLWGEERVYKKVYESEVYWSKEVAVLEQIARVRTYEIPRLLYSSREELMTILSEVPGTTVHTEIESVLPQLASALHHLHAQPCTLEPLSLGPVLQRFQANITASEYLTSIEKRIAKRAYDQLVATDWVGQTMQHRNLVHGDINCANVLFVPEQGMLGIIDFERATIGDGMLDLAKAAWRIFHDDPVLVKELLTGYCGYRPQGSEWQRFELASIYEYLGAVSYFAYEGYRKQYPFKDTAIANLDRLCGM